MKKRLLEFALSGDLVEVSDGEVGGGSAGVDIGARASGDADRSAATR